SHWRQVDCLSFPCSGLTLRSSSEFPELWESGLDRATTAILIMDTDIIPTDITTDHIPTTGITEDGHIPGITGIEFTTITIIITIAIGGTKDTKETRTNNKVLTVVALRLNNEDRSPARIYG